MPKRDQALEDEKKAIAALRDLSPHPNVVSILNDGWTTEPFPFYFIDMELCDIALDAYLSGQRPAAFQSSDNAAFVAKDSTELSTLQNIWRISGDIAAGLEFLHENRLAHRDLKPGNGSCPVPMAPS
jgi:serine/threonine protein kinase